MFGYDICPLCGAVHDDGEWFPIGKKYYFICLDCGDNLTDEEKEEKLNNIFGNN